MKKIAIIGTRERDSNEDFKAVLKAFNNIYVLGDWIVSGGCPKGGDRFAEKIAKDRGVPILIFYPPWTEYGKRAPFVRNKEIAKHADYIIACYKTGSSKGTANTIWEFLKEHSEDPVHPGKRLVLV